MEDNLQIFYFIQAFACLLVCIFFVLRSFEDKLRFGKTVTYIVGCAYIIISVAIIELFFESVSPFPQYAAAAGIFWAVISVVFAVSVFRANFLSLLFFVFAMMNIQINIMFIAKSICAFPLFGAVSDSTYLLVSVLLLLLSTPLMWYLYISLFKRVVDMDLTYSYWRRLFVIPLSYFMFCWINIATRPTGLSATPGIDLAIMFFLSTCMFLSYSAVLQLLIKTDENRIANEKANMSAQIISMQKEQYHRIADHIEKTDRLSHDFRHHLIAIDDFAARGDIPGLRGYLDKFKRDIPKSSISPVCSNHFVNVILTHYIAKAVSCGIRVNTSEITLDKFSMPETDLCVVLGNLFENALESCCRQSFGDKYIDLNVKNISDSMLAITVTNSYDGVIKRSGNDFISSKTGTPGIGTRATRSVAEKNNGSCIFSYDDGVFRAYVLLVS